MVSLLVESVMLAFQENEIYGTILSQSIFQTHSPTSVNIVILLLGLTKLCHVILNVCTSWTETCTNVNKILQSDWSFLFKVRSPDQRILISTRIVESMVCSSVTFVMSSLVKGVIESGITWSPSIFLNNFHIHVLVVARFWRPKMPSQTINIQRTRNVEWPWIIISGGISSYEDFDKYIEKDIEKGYCCTICGQFRKRGFSEVRNHIESKHFPNSFSYQCNMCNLTLGTNTALTRHQQRVHKMNWWGVMIHDFMTNKVWFISMLPIQSFIFQHLLYTLQEARAERGFNKLHHEVWHHQDEWGNCLDHSPKLFF